VRSLAGWLCLGMSVGAGACFEQGLTREEANEAVTSSNLAGEAQALTYDVIDVSTHFTIGQAVDQAAQELRTFAASQIPCSTVSVAQATVTIDFGTLQDDCKYRGHSYAGVVKISVQGASGELHVHHQWQGFTNGTVTLDGDADVTWSAAAESRHVTYSAVSTHAGRAETLHSSGEVTQKWIDAQLGWAGGVEIDGTREWYLESGRVWNLDIEGIEARAQDPVPQAGRYVLTTPSDKHLTLEFERLSDTQIRVTVKGAQGHTYEIDVTSLR
jgi:hypothetical protein